MKFCGAPIRWNGSPPPALCCGISPEKPPSASPPPTILNCVRCCPTRTKWQHFEEAIAGDTIAFDYRLRPGPACTRNAIRLLTLMGFDKALTQEAENRAERYLQEGVW